MKTLRKQSAVVILTLMLAFSAYAGQIQGTGIHSSGTGTGTGTTTLADVITTTIVTIISVIP